MNHSYALSTKTFLEKGVNKKGDRYNLSVGADGRLLKKNVYITCPNKLRLIYKAHKVQVKYPISRVFSGLNIIGSSSILAPLISIHLFIADINSTIYLPNRKSVVTAETRGTVIFSF